MCSIVTGEIATLVGRFETALYAILDLCASAKVGFGFIVTSASQETLAASNNSRIMETVHSYME